MVFSSVVFLFLFLPAVLAAHALVPRRGRNLLLLFFSLLFYAWGEAFYVILMLGSIAMNYVFGLWVEASRKSPRHRLVLGCAIAANLGALAVFKYSSFLLATLKAVLGDLTVFLSLVGISLELKPVHLPIGISFYTFQAMSYVIDVYRGQVPPEKRPVNVGLYISMFPQLIAGPIVRYRDIAAQLGCRAITTSDFAYGVRRFIVGLGKKVLIANTLAVPADRAFALAPDRLTPGIAWLGVVAFTLQIYFDFAGYSDMAIGLGRMFGFRFLENFNYPYISRSIREFWKRWHISLSSWFRDYLYIPLGGSRRSPPRVYLNLVTVFLLCGLWHGASWTFAIWGLYHGLFLVLERVLVKDQRPSPLGPLRHIYAVVVVIVGWVLFRADTFGQALAFLGAMLGLGGTAGAGSSAGAYLTSEVALAMAAGALGSTPVVPWLAGRFRTYTSASPARGRVVLAQAGSFAAVVGLAAILVACGMSLSAGTHNPFIYFRF